MNKKQLSVWFTKTMKQEQVKMLTTTTLNTCDGNKLIEHTGYHFTHVSWNDNQRDQGSSYGSNITDARLRGRSGELYLVVRPNNFDEKIARVKSSEVSLISSEDGAEITLSNYLQNFKKHAQYAFAQEITTPTSLLKSKDDEDEYVGIRFQAVFLPVKSESDNTTEFYAETYNYQTRDPAQPRNMILLCTSQGTFPQQDKPRICPHYTHKKSEHSDSWWCNHFLHASCTKHEISLSQEKNESANEKAEALKNGQSISRTIGIKSMGSGFNRLMTIQVPLVQDNPPREWFEEGCVGCCCPLSDKRDLVMLGGNMTVRHHREGLNLQKKNKSYAARVSHGSVASNLKLMDLINPRRDPECAITITVQFYFMTPPNAKVTHEDVLKAIQICDDAYSKCEWSGQLMDSASEIAFVKTDLTQQEQNK